MNYKKIIQNMNNDEKFEIIQDIYCREEIGTFLKIMGLNNRICELGVAAGANLWWLVKHAHPNYVLAIDCWSEEICPFYNQAKHDNQHNRVIKIFSKAHKWAGTEMEIVKGDHNDLAVNYEDESFDFVYIDSDHQYEPTVNDIRIWWPKVRSGGILAGHDYNSRNKLYGVVEAVDEFVEANNIKYFYTTKEYPKSWIILKE